MDRILKTYVSNPGNVVGKIHQRAISCPAEVIAVPIVTDRTVILEKAQFQYSNQLKTGGIFVGQTKEKRSIYPRGRAALPLAVKPDVMLCGNRSLPIPVVSCVVSCNPEVILGIAMRNWEGPQFLDLTGAGTPTTVLETRQPRR